MAVSEPPRPADDTLSPAVVMHSAARMTGRGSRILYVGGTPQWFQRIEIGFRELKPDWSCRHAANRQEALKALAGGSYDALLLHGWAEEDGNFLEVAARQLPNMLRFLRCSPSDRAMAARCQRLQLTAIGDKEDARGMAAVIKGAIRLHVWTADRAIRQLLPLMRKLPVAPDLYSKINERLRSPVSSLDDVAQLITQEPVMSAKLLQLVNSSFFGLASEINDPAQAVMFLGTERTRSLILLAGVFTQFGNVQCGGLPEPVLTHSLAVGSLAAEIALAETGDPKIEEAAFTAGLLHDIGKLLLAGNLPAISCAIRKLQDCQSGSPIHAEMTVMGTTHADLGACLLGTWGLPLAILEAIAWHHCPERSEDTEFSLLTAVHVANVLSMEAGLGSGAPGTTETLSLPYLKRLGLAQRRNRWRELCELPTKPEEESEDPHQLRREAKEN